MAKIKIKTIIEKNLILFTIFTLKLFNYLANIYFIDTMANMANIDNIQQFSTLNCKNLIENINNQLALSNIILKYYLVGLIIIFFFNNTIIKFVNSENNRNTILFWINLCVNIVVFSSNEKYLGNLQCDEPIYQYEIINVIAFYIFGDIFIFLTNAFGFTLLLRYIYLSLKYLYDYIGNIEINSTNIENFMDLEIGNKKIED